MRIKWPKFPEMPKMPEMPDFDIPESMTKDQGDLIIELLRLILKELRERK